MNDPQPNPAKQPLSAKQLLVALGALTYMLVTFAVAQLYSPLVGGLMLLPILIAIPIGISRLSSQQKQRMTEAMEKQDQSRFGQFMNIVKLGLLLFLGAAFLQWAYERFF